MKSARPNRLASEKSPYLLQHAHNPVDWYPWGEDAFTKARVENKPIFLSIGYSTCHWCHVMERESFQDNEVARLLNETFVCIKVDREERPDIDSYYMTVCQLLSGTAGWPLTIIMSPEKQPFFATTYLPKTSRFGRIGLIEFIPQLENMWKTRKEQLMKSSHDISALIRHTTKQEEAEELTEPILHAAYEGLDAQYDNQAGGFGRAPKFPMPHNLLFLMRYWQNTGQERALNIVEDTLTAMRMGGIYDHIGYGFHRYSTDKNWRLPHFEKMLYDQALLILTYTEAYAITKKPLYKTTAREIIEYVERDMMSEQGAFYSAEDADSEGQEGKYYLWKESEVRKVLDATELGVIRKVFNIKETGNYNGEASDIDYGQNLIYMSESFEQQAETLGIPQNELKKYLTSAREKMLRYREKRAHPHKDKKILCDWNGIMIAALAKAGRIMENKKYIDIARRAVNFVLAEMRDHEGWLYHRFIDGERAIPGFLDDYAFLTWGLIELYGASFEIRYLQAAILLSERAQEMFGDDDGGAFYFTQKENDLPLRKKETYDGAVPAGNSQVALNMLRLARLTGRADLEATANRIIKEFSSQIKQNPLNHIQMLNALNMAFFPSPEIVIVGDLDDPVTQEMLGTINRSPLLDTLVALKNTENTSDIVKLAPFTKNLAYKDDQPTAYLCRNYQCDIPTHESGILAKMIDEHMKTRQG